MNILHINCNYIYTRLHQLMIQRLDEMGVINKVYCPVVKKAQGIIAPNENVIVSECFSNIDRTVFYYKQSKIMKDLLSKIDVENFGLVHAYTLFTDGNIAYQLEKRYGVPFVVAVRDTDVNTFFKRVPYLRKRGIEILKNAKMVFFLSHTYYELVLSKYVPQCIKEEIKRKSHIIPNGIDSYWLDNNYYKSDAITIRNRMANQKIVHAVYVGAISKRKNVGATIKAFRSLRKEGWRIDFSVIGKVENQAEYRKIQKDKHTEYLGPKSKEEILQIFRKKDIFIMPSLTETFGLTYAEAMSQGLPVIYSKGQGFDGQFDEGTVGYAVDAYSTEDIVEKFKLICYEYESLSINCSKYAKKFDWSNIVNDYVGLYKQLGL